jgi:hypothetical protein
MEPRGAGKEKKPMHAGETQTRTHGERRWLAGLARSVAASLRRAIGSSERPRQNFKFYVRAVLPKALLLEIYCYLGCTAI